jgi:hypothetical protein
VPIFRGRRGYNWAVEPGANFPSQLEFVPMLHRPDFIQAFEASEAVKTAKYILGFNEPNVSSPHPAIDWR